MAKKMIVSKQEAIRYGWKKGYRSNLNETPNLFDCAYVAIVPAEFRWDWRRAFEWAETGPSSR